MTRWTWYGSMIGSRFGHLAERVLREVTAVDDDARAADWDAVLEARPWDRLNVWRPGSTTCATPLHHAAAGGASPEIIRALVSRGAWRTLTTLDGLRPVDVARARHADPAVVEALEPAPTRRFAPSTLSVWQSHVDALIRATTAPLAGRYQLRCPPLDVLTELPAADVLWFPVPGMTGGFALRLTDEGVVVSSTSRVVEGGSESHVITEDGARALPDELPV